MKEQNDLKTMIKQLPIVAACVTVAYLFITIITNI